MLNTKSYYKNSCSYAPFLAHLAKGNVSFCHLPTKFRFIWPSGFGGEDLKKLANQKQELPVVAMFVNFFFSSPCQRQL
jgi:hypothetical protein